MKTTTQLIEDSISVAKTYEKMVKELCEDIIPSICFQGFMYGSMTKNQKEEYDKKQGNNNPIKEYIQKTFDKITQNFCQKCGNELIKEDKFCSKCGAKAKT